LEPRERETTLEEFAHSKGEKGKSEKKAGGKVTLGSFCGSRDWVRGGKLREKVRERKVAQGEAGRSYSRTFKEDPLLRRTGREQKSGKKGG